MQSAETRATSSLEEICRDSTHCTCACGNVVFFYSTAEPTAEYCERNARAVIDYARTHPRGLGMFVLIAADEPPPSEPARRAIADSYVMMRQVIGAGVLVVEGEGFAASAKRSVITLITMSASSPFPIRVARNLDEGAIKLSKMLGARLDPRLDAHVIAAAAASTQTRLQPRHHSGIR